METHVKKEEVEEQRREQVREAGPSAPRPENGHNDNFEGSQKKDIIVLARDVPDTPLDVHWEDVFFLKQREQRMEGKPRAISMQSPMLVPRLIMESPALNPHQLPLQQLDEGDNFLERRRPSIAEGPECGSARKGTEDVLDFGEFKRPRTYRRESIIPLDPVKEEGEELDRDGFRRPKVVKGNETQDTLKEEYRRELERENAFKARYNEEKKGNTPQKENFRVALTLNPQMAPCPMLGPALMQTYTPDYAACYQPTYFAFGNDYGRKMSDCLRKEGEYGYPAVCDTLQPTYFLSPYIQASPAFHLTPQQLPEQPMMMCAGYGQEEFRLDSAPAPAPAPAPVSAPAPAPAPTTPQLEPKPAEEAVPEQKIGTLTVSERKEKIQKYLEKRKRRIWKKKISYDCRKKVADKRLRIKGRFVTREQAYAILGTTAEDLAKNELLRNLVSSNNGCSIITSAQNMKIRNIQTLFVSSDKAKADNEVPQPVVEPAPTEEDKAKHEVKVEILKENLREQTVEIKIETIAKRGTSLRKSGQVKTTLVMNHLQAKRIQNSYKINLTENS